MILDLDTSSLVKLYVEKEGSDEIRALVDQADIVSTSAAFSLGCSSIRSKRTP